MPVPELGPLTWTDLPVLRSAPIVAGRQLIEGPTSWAASHPGGAPGIPTAGGTTLRQRLPADRLAPQMAQQALTFSGLAVEAEDWRHLVQVQQSGGAFDFFVEWSVVDTWRIRADDPVRTLFQLSRPYPLDLFTRVALPPRAVVEDVPGSPTPLGPQELTIIGSGVPGPGEILIADGTRVVEVQTDDLAPEGPWRQLSLHYFPMYVVTISSASQSWQGGGGLTFAWELLEHLPPRNWRATA